MPCYQSRTYSVEFKAEHKGLLQQAAESLGASLSVGEEASVTLVTFKDGNIVAISNGKATGRNQDQVNSLRVAYSEAVVNQAKQWAQAKGWNAQQQSNGKLVLTKGGRR